MRALKVVAAPSLGKSKSKQAGIGLERHGDKPHRWVAGEHGQECLLCATRRSWPGAKMACPSSNAWVKKEGRPRQKEPSRRHKDGSKTFVVSAWVGQEDRERVKRLAQKSGLSVYEFVGRIIREKLDGEVMGNAASQNQKAVSRRYPARIQD